MATYKEIYKTISIFGSVHALTILLNLLRTKLIAILIGTFGTGLNSLYFEARELLHLATNLGLDVSAIRNISMDFEAWKKAKSNLVPSVSPEGKSPVPPVSPEGKAWQRLTDSVRLIRSMALMLALLGMLAMLVFSLPLSYFMFMDHTHTIDFIILAPTVALTTLICSEMAILKAMRKIKTLAAISILNVIIAIAVSAPIYYHYGIRGILPAILLLLLLQYLIVIHYTYHIVKPSIRFNKTMLQKAYPILKLGIAMTMAGIAMRLSQLAIRSFINNQGGTDAVGLYNSGYTILMMLGGLIFSSIDTDYYPRLSGAFSSHTERRTIVYRQIKANLSLMIPLVTILIPLLPWIVPLLLSHDFDPIIPMVQVASLSLIFRAATQPYGYIPIAAGNPKLHMLLEAYCDILILIAVAAGFTYYGLLGAGIGYLLSNIIDTIVLWAVMKWKYDI